MTWFGIEAVAGGLFVQISLFLEHTTFDEQGVHWQTWPWQDESSEPWSAVTGVRTDHHAVGEGSTKPPERYLVLTFADGTHVNIGRLASMPPSFWQRPAELASERSGVAVYWVPIEH